MCTGKAMSETSRSIKTERLFSNMPANNLVFPMANHSCCWCTWCWFQTFENTNTENTALARIARVDIHPAALLFLPGKQTFTTKANNGSKTAASANRMVNVSIACKKFSNVSFWLKYLQCSFSRKNRCVLDSLESLLF